MTAPSELQITAVKETMNSRSLSGKAVVDEKKEEDKACVLDDGVGDILQGRTDPGGINDDKEDLIQPIATKADRKLQAPQHTSPASILVPSTTLRRQDENVILQPGAFRMRGSTHDVVQDEDQTVTETVVEEGGPPTQAPPLVNAELVVERNGPGEILDSVDLEQGSYPGATVDSSQILTASAMEDKHIISHLLRQRRVQLSMLVAILCVLGLTVGLVVALSRGGQSENNPTVILIENGTQTIISDDDTIESLTGSEELDDD
jgi:hypothetical protein